MNNESTVKGSRRKQAAVIIVVAAAIVIALAVILPSGKDSSAVQDSASTQPLERMDLEQVVTAKGTVHGVDSRNVVVGNVSSQIASVKVSEGQAVKKGDVLCVMDTELLDLNISATRDSLDSAISQHSESVAQASRRVKDAQSQYSYDKKRLNAEVKKAKKALGEAKKKGASGSAALPEATLPQEKTAGAAQSGTGTASLQAAYDAAVSTRDATLRTDRSAIKSAQDALKSQKLMDQTSALQGQLDAYLKQKDDAKVRAPISGTVTSVHAKEGEYPSMEAPMFVIDDIGHLQVDALIPEYDASLLKTGLRVHIVSDAIQNAEWDGEIEKISAVASDESGDFTITVRVKSELGALKSGMSAKLNIVSDSRAGVFAVPYGALGSNAKGEPVIYVKQGGGENSDGSGEGGDNAAPEESRREIVVATGLETDYYVEISGDGLTSGLPVLIDPEGIVTDEAADPLAQFENN